MREITHIEFQSKYELICEFNDNSRKYIDLKVFADKEAFLFLKNENHFSELINKKYFIEWPAFEADLSADTLWHIGKPQL